MDREDGTKVAMWGGTSFRRPGCSLRLHPVGNGNSPAYREVHKRSMEDPEGFWAGRAEELVTWSQRWHTVLDGELGSPDLKWFAGAMLNPTWNCLDRHLENGRRNKAALIWQGESDNETRVFTYQMLYAEVCRFANILKKKGVGKGESVAIYLPMIPELVIAVLACARLGVLHCVVFSGFSSASLKTRLEDCRAKVLITADAIIRAGRTIPLKPNADEALDECDFVEACIVVRKTERDIVMKPKRDTWWHEERQASGISAICEPVEMAANDDLFILYTSGSTGKPKRVVHRAGGYLLYAMHTCQWVFDLQDDDIFWCTADIGWITGHTYGIYGPLGLGATTLIYEGIPLYPGPDRFWQIVEKFNVTIFYTAPTVIRALMRYGVGPVEKYDISSLRLLGSVGEPINPEAWNWYHAHIGKNKLPIIDTWWQTETGGIMIAPLAETVPLKPGAAAQPLPGIDVMVVDAEGREVGNHEGGRLVIRQPWPGMCKDLCGEQDPLQSSHHVDSRWVYDTGDGARCDEDGYFWIMGRLDDIINVSGHRLGTAEIESALLTHRSVSEAAVVGMPHPLKGQAIYAYVTLNRNVQQTGELLEELRNHVRGQIGPIATLEGVQYTDALPKTRSGKIMRRLLKKIAADDFDDFGDISSLADPSIISELIEGKKSSSET